MLEAVVVVVRTDAVGDCGRLLLEWLKKEGEEEEVEAGEDPLFCW
jgi:hypothetical protein